MNTEAPHWRCVLSTGDVLLLELAQSILDSEKIRYVVEGEILQDLVGSGRAGLGYNQAAGPAEIWVSEDRADDVATLLKNLRMDNDT